MTKSLKSSHFPAPMQLAPTPGDARCREVRGAGTGTLAVPGLRRLTGIATPTLSGPVQLALTEPRLHLQRSNPALPGALEDVEEQLFVLHGAGTPAAHLRRSQVSNDGVFQAGVAFFVEGEWA